jgi:pimeloyl-ACP methyl ester carboxylesterase
MTKNTLFPFIPALGIGAALGYTLAQQIWLHSRLQRIDPYRSLAGHTNLAAPGRQEIERLETETYTRVHAVEDGIERIVYTPKQRRFETPLLFQHGMWHGAWCWQPWQELFAGWGWESIAVSLPGHAGSPEQRPIRLCTLDYYLGFLKAEIDRLPLRPVLVGHSMGGALAQWYFRYVGQALPAAVLVAPWVSHNAARDALWLFMKADPLGMLLVAGDWSTSPYVRSPAVAARLLLGKNAAVTPEWLHARLGPESGMITFQHNPPYWRPAEQVNTPILWIAAGEDAVITVDGARRSAAHYGACFLVVPGAGHNLMMEHNQAEVARRAHNWLVQQEIA